MRTPTPDLDKLWTMHGAGPRFANATDNALVIWEARLVDVSWVRMDQVVHAIRERGMVEPSAYLKPAPAPVVVPVVTAAMLRDEMPPAPTIQPDVTLPPPEVEPPKKPLWSRIKDAAFG